MINRKANQLSRNGKLFWRCLCLCLAMVMLLTGCVSKLPDEQLPDNGKDDGKNDETNDTPNDEGTTDSGNTDTDAGDTDTDDDTSSADTEDYRPTNMKVNLLDEPFGVQKNDLRFSWAMGATVLAAGSISFS